MRESPAGEEVKLYCVNGDRYCIKTAEYLHDNAVLLAPEDGKHPIRVHFSLVDATGGGHGNVKESNQKVFVPAAGAYDDLQCCAPGTPCVWNPGICRGG